MDVVEQVDGATVTLRLNGELDMATVPAFQQQAMSRLTDAGLSTLVVDLGGVSFLDSGGLTCLVVLQERADQLGIALVLTGVSRQTRKLMAVTSLTDMFTLR